MWTMIARVGTLMSLGAALMELYNSRHREVNSSRIYNSTEAARFLGVERKEVIRLLEQGRMRGRLVNGNYRVPGSSIIEYLSHDS
ncbi:helix-turn-helix domain-containing protein [Terasakiella sp. SH-1]|uniref:helix-turn-helix domain-containing protein n=1 Tax=Terasakiella sp. SH-1 TaxID=2560057 RepID=UPI0010740749|nr:helix-turn-helix domain-containing protein [Terasakiella sp. SH-1]